MAVSFLVSAKGLSHGVPYLSSWLLCIFSPTPSFIMMQQSSQAFATLIQSSFWVQKPKRFCSIENLLLHFHYRRELQYRIKVLWSRHATFLCLISTSTKEHWQQKCPVLLRHPKSSSFTIVCGYQIANRNRKAVIKITLMSLPWKHKKVSVHNYSIFWCTVLCFPPNWFFNMSLNRCYLQICSASKAKPLKSGSTSQCLISLLINRTRGCDVIHQPSE